MNQNRTMMRGKLADLVEKRKTARKDARALCRQIVPMINPDLEDIKDMDLATADRMMDNLVMLQVEILVMNSKISGLEESLYG